MSFIESLSQLYNTLNTDSGFWNPLVWILAFVTIFLVAYIIRSYGNKGYKKNTEQTKVFLSGNPEFEDKEEMRVKANNLYWGFTETLKGVYKVLDRMHSGNTSDFILWFVVILGIFLVSVVFAGVF